MRFIARERHGGVRRLRRAIHRELEPVRRRTRPRPGRVPDRRRLVGRRPPHVRRPRRRDDGADGGGTDRRLPQPKNAAITRPHRASDAPHVRRRSWLAFPLTDAGIDGRVGGHAGGVKRVDFGLGQAGDAGQHFARVLSEERGVTGDVGCRTPRTATRCRACLNVVHLRVRHARPRSRARAGAGRRGSWRCRARGRPARRPPAAPPSPPAGRASAVHAPMTASSSS